MALSLSDQSEEPSAWKRDYDFATPLAPAAVKERLSPYPGVKLLDTGLRHGTVTFVKEGFQAEITSFRSDSHPDGRHARVRFGVSIEADAARRDLTLNALYVNRAGDVLDPLGTGLQDLHEGRVRTCGDPYQRFQEDYLRVMRYYRFWVRFAKKPPDRHHRDALQACAPQLERLSRERVQDELRKLMSLPQAGRAIRLMASHGLLSHLGLVFRPQSWPRWRYALAAGLAPNPNLGFGLLAPEGRAGETAEKLRCARDEARFLAAVCDKPPAWPSEPDLTDKGFRRIWRGLCWLEGSALCQGRAGWAYLHGALSYPNYRELLRAIRGFVPPVFPLRGADLIEQGYRPGPDLGRALARAQQVWLDSQFRPSRQALLELLEGHLPAPR